MFVYAEMLEVIQFHAKLQKSDIFYSKKTKSEIWLRKNAKSDIFLRKNAKSDISHKKQIKNKNKNITNKRNTQQHEQHKHRKQYKQHEQQHKATMKPPQPHCSTSLNDSAGTRRTRSPFFSVRRVEERTSKRPSMVRCLAVKQPAKSPPTRNTDLLPVM